MVTFNQAVVLATLTGLAALGAAPQTRKAEPAQPQTQTAPSAPDAGSGDTGVLTLQLSGNRNFCVNQNEIEMKPGTVKPRQERSAPLITTFGYKYQISASRRGATGVTKLLESPVIRTAYNERPRPSPQLPGPRLATPKDAKRAGAPYQKKKIPRWIPQGTCTTLQGEYSFPVAPGRYDLYLGFDVLLQNGQWAPLQSDYITDVVVEKNQVTRVHGSVDYTNGVRTVKMESSEKPHPPGNR